MQGAWPNGAFSGPRRCQARPPSADPLRLATFRKLRADDATLEIGGALLDADESDAASGSAGAPGSAKAYKVDFRSCPRAAMNSLYCTAATLR